MRTEGTRTRYWIVTMACAVLAATPTRLEAAEPAVVPGVLPDKWLNGGPNCNELP